MENLSLFWAGLALVGAFAIGFGIRLLFLLSNGLFTWRTHFFKTLATAVVGVTVAFLLAWIGKKDWFGLGSVLLGFLGFLAMIAAGFLSFYWMTTLDKKKGG